MNQPLGRRRIQGFCIVLLGCLFFGIRGYYDQTEAVQSRDFKCVYTGARCLIDGCDSYDYVQLRRVMLEHGGDLSDPVPFAPYTANYLPSALFFAIPLAMLPYGPAHVIWLIMSILLFCCAAFCISDLCVGRCALIVQCILAVFVALNTMPVMLAQPALMSISLVVIALWCFLRQRCLAIGVASFAISLVFKPHLGALVWLFLLFSNSCGLTYPNTSETSPRVRFRRLALQILVVAFVLSVPGVFLAFHHPATSHWPQELRANLQGIAGQGHLSNPGPTNADAPSIANLQALFSLIHDIPSFYNRATIAVFLPLFLIWVYLVVRPMEHPQLCCYGTTRFTLAESRDLLALASASALSFLPLYHRQYDTGYLLLMFPAVALLASCDRVRGRLAIALSIFATITMTHQFPHLGTLLSNRVGRLPGPVWLLFNRPLPLTLLLLTCFFLYCMFLLSMEQRQA
jgi:hypothetical protein